MDSPGLIKKQQQISYWIIIVMLIIFSLFGGIIGFRNYFFQINEPSDWIRAIYRTLQLFTFENGDFQRANPLDFTGGSIYSTFNSHDCHHYGHSRDIQRAIAKYADHQIKRS